MKSMRKNIVLSNSNFDIDKADRLDYAIAVSSGVLCGMIDSLFVGEFSLTDSREWGEEKVNRFVRKIANSQGYQGDDLKRAIKYLEDHFELASDSLTSEYGGGKQHHLRDFAHHPSVAGLAFSILTQFTKECYGTDTSGKFLPVKLKDTSMIGESFSQKILFGTVYWFFHLVSDMAGSNATPGKGTGIPGPILSLAKELSALPFFKNDLNKEGNRTLSVYISKLFNGTLLAKKDESGIIEAVRFDLRMELGIAHFAVKQTIPNIINQAIVRCFFFIRMLSDQLKQKKVKSVADLKSVDWKQTLPAKNRTVARMMTVSTGVFSAVDMADAAIRAGLSERNNDYSFKVQCALRINYLALGRFGIALMNDIYYLVKGLLE